jgi:hypothetical protein
VLLGAVTLIAVALTAAAVFAVVSLIAARREAEFGTMLALGATPSRIRSLVVGSAVKLALAASRLSMPLLYAVIRAAQASSQVDVEWSWSSWLGALTVLVLVMASAVTTPARRAANTSLVTLMSSAAL